MFRRNRVDNERFVMLRILWLDRWPSARFLTRADLFPVEVAVSRDEAELY